MRKALIVATVIILSSTVSGLDATIAKDCSFDVSEYEPVISMAAPNGTISNPGPPDMYRWKLCVDGIQESSISTSCEKKTGFFISSKTKKAHLSFSDSYNLHVCTENIKVNFRAGQCFDNQTKLISMSGKSNAHVANPGVFGNHLCGSLVRPENITMEMEANLSSNDEVYFDDTEIDPGDKEYPPAEFPYLVSVSDQYTTGIVKNSFQRAERRISGRNSLILKSDTGKKFLIPFFSGDRDDVEERQQLIMDSEFMAQLKPSFSQVIPDEPNVKVSFTSDVELESDLDLFPGSYSLNITKIGENRVRIERE